MNKIEKLISELCPDGIEFKELGEVLDYIQPTKYIVESSKYSDEFDLPVLTAGKTFILGYTDEKEGIFKASKENPVIIFDDFTTSFHWVDFNFKVKSSALKIIKLKEEIDEDFRFIYHAMKCIGYKPQDHARHWISKYSKITIPLPDTKIQKEIVKILDNFTVLEAELEAELEARNKQYEYYRDKILSLEKNIQEKSLEEVIVSLKTGLNPRKNFTLNTVDAQNYYVTVRELGGIDINFLKKTDRVNDNGLKLINNRSKLEKGDVLFSGTGTIGRTALVKEKPINWNIKEGVYVIKPNKEYIDSKFLLFFLNSTNAIKQIENKVVGSPVSSIPMTELKKIKIKIPFISGKPDLDKQKEIVNTIDKFYKLTNDISEGLPAEIKVRKQQYEYYREKLLTFKELKK